MSNVLKLTVTIDQESAQFNIDEGTTAKVKIGDKIVHIKAEKTEE